jgi:nitronate monooxygenase
VHDDIQGTGFWPADIDGRAIMGESYKDFVSGLPIDENISRHKKANETGDTSRKIVWA